MQIRLVSIPGDGVGPEVVAATLPVIQDAALMHGAGLDVLEVDWGGERHLRTGAPMPDDAAELVRSHDAVLFGAVGRPDVPDHELVWGLIIALRQQLDLAVNLRPVRSWENVPSVVTSAPGTDLLIVRENTEGEYTGVGGRTHRGREAELGIEVAVHSRPAIERAARYAFEQAGRRRGQVALVTKSNAMRHGYTLWDEIVAEVAAEFPAVECQPVLVDAMAAQMIQRPAELDVLLCSNLFGDILADLAAVLAGGMGMAPSANVSPATTPGLFEPIHGSAPDIAGQGIANPTACMLSGAMMFDHVGLPAAGDSIRNAIAVALLDSSNHTPDLGGTGTTDGLAAAVRSALNRERNT
ncbi:isocitrate/isopropylmalate dehydrogenase family protein [Phytoactinopolyspora sp. XMNu-373]|uniref:Isocitrate/isopropylmalate dehydrogenase family protein n=2 Tax=Phytoactinopolyspora mesophila TaxID=2650750 RepID=A0A7K3M8G0_9ACTN|nr:isocitrate/isopropylmalate dehydrogenase family protein [Phytoactinopolyspora mesophila]NDL59564.1 isocitrate/isopropylmalate dehydrogenase family protein [Phytoactinopolyspora mesophila]